MDFNLGGIQGWREIQNAVDALTLTNEVRSNGRVPVALVRLVELPDVFVVTSFSVTVNWPTEGFVSIF